MLLLAAPALAARPPTGARYKGTTSQHAALTANVTADGSGLQLSFEVAYKCNRGPGKTARATYRMQRPSLRADGTFDFLEIDRNLAPVPGFAERHTERQHLTGGFSAGGGRLHGRAADTVVGAGGLRCTATVTFSAAKR